MAIADLTSEVLTLPQPIAHLLGAVRRRIWMYALLEAAAESALWLGLGFWLGLAIDWAFEPDWGVRRLAWGLIVMGVGVILYRRVLRRLTARVSDANVAMLLERRFPQLADRLLTTVELAGRTAPAHEFNADLLFHTAGEAIDLTADVRVFRAFNWPRLLLRIGGAIAIVASIASLAAMAPRTFGFYVARITGTNEPWPRETLLTVEGFSTEFAIDVTPAEATDEAHSSRAAAVEVHAISGRIDIRPRGARENLRIASGTALALAAADDQPANSERTSFSPHLIPPLADETPSSIARDDTGVATIRRGLNLTMTCDDRSVEPGDGVSAAVCRVASGVAELLTRTGVEIRLSAPAEFTLHASDALELHEGRAHVTVPVRAAGFTVHTPQGRVMSVRRDTIKIVRGSDASILVSADALKTLPRWIEIRHRTADGPTQRETLQQDSTAVPGRDRVQRYSYVFRSVLDPIEFDLVGGDEKIRHLRIEPVDSPKLIDARAACTYPAYLVDAASGRYTPRELPIGGPLEIPQGTQVVLRGTANRALSAVQVKTAASAAPRDVPLTADRGDSRSLSFDVGRVEQHMVLFFTLTDEDGLSNREPLPIELVARTDEPPQVGLRLRGIGSAITPDALLPAQGEIHDDYGTKRVWYAFAVGADKPRELTVTTLPSPARKLTFTTPHVPAARDIASAAEPTVGDGSAVLDLRAVRRSAVSPIKPGDNLIVSIKAADACDLAGRTNVGESDRYHLEVVTPDELRGILEAREFALRQKFETILDEFQQTRDSLTNLLGANAEGSRGSVVAERLAQNTDRGAYEIEQLAAALDDVRAELWHNRIDAREVHVRLDERIAQPLRAVVARRFPPLSKTLGDLRKRVQGEERLARATPATAETVRKELESLRPTFELATAARQQMDEILADLRGVLREMHELEDYNKLVDRLRTLIKRQEELQQQTIRKQREELEK